MIYINQLYSCYYFSHTVNSHRNVNNPQNNQVTKLPPCSSFLYLDDQNNYSQPNMHTHAWTRYPPTCLHSLARSHTQFKPSSFYKWVASKEAWTEEKDMGTMKCGQVDTEKILKSSIKWQIFHSYTFCYAFLFIIYSYMPIEH